MKRMVFAGILFFAAVFPAVSSETKNTDNVTARAHLTSDEMTMEEYKAIRAEILQCLQSRVTILSLGFPAVGALLAAGATVLTRGKQYWIFSALIIGVGVTLTSLYVVDLWMEETQRMARASYHNFCLELKLNKLFPGQVAPLEWEQRVRIDKNYRRILPTDAGTPRMFLWLSVVSGVSGLFLFWRGTEGFRRRYWLAIPVALIGILFMCGTVYTRYKQMGALEQIWGDQSRCE